MWDLLKKGREDCARFQDLLEGSADGRPQASQLEELMEGLPRSQREHVAHCGRCREAGEDHFAARKVFTGVDSRADAGGPWFAARVMRAIAARERELAISPSPWSVVPHFASRLAWVTAIVLLAGSSWLYEKSFRASVPPPSGAAINQEYIFEAPQPPPNQDDVLISMAEKNP